jgi:cytochrome c
MGGIVARLGTRMRLAAVVLAIALAACGAEKPALEGNPESGRLLLRQFGCGSCHRIPGVADAQGNVGPPLDGVARRVYLAGVVPNSPERMARWIRTPKAFDPKTAMPELGVGEEHARDMVAYLYRLR